MSANLTQDVTGLRHLGATHGDQTQRVHDGALTHVDTPAYITDKPEKFSL
jgi:hypothetical protein